MSALGIYFGTKVISIVETMGRRVLNNIKIPLSTVSLGELEEKVPDEIKIVALIKEELRKRRISAKEVTIALTGRDLIIRTFEMPILPLGELKSAVTFEAKKYIPFKVEDLVSDSQFKLDKSTRGNLVLYMGIKKDTIDKYLAIMRQLSLKINYIEYSVFSILRFLKSISFSDAGTIALISADFQEEDEVNFVVLDHGFPLFSRDIALGGEFGEFGRPEGRQPEAILEKLKAEIRVSLDYYHRKYPTKKIQRTSFIAEQEYQELLDTFSKEVGLSAQFVDITKYTDRKVAGFSLSFIKGYGTSLLKTIKILPRIDLLAARERSLREVEVVSPELAHIFTRLKVKPQIIFLAVFICLVSFALGFYRIAPLSKELKTVINMRPKTSLANPEAKYEELNNLASEYKRKLDALDEVVKKQLYVTEPLDTLPRILPADMRLVNFSFRKQDKTAELTLEGIAFLGNSNKEFDLVNNFLSDLKNNAIFNKYFKAINIVSLDSRQIDRQTMTYFVISCRAP